MTIIIKNGEGTDVKLRPQVHDLTISEHGLPGVSGIEGVGLPLGGQVGQVLGKASSNDYDATWVAPSAGSAGATVDGVSGGGAIMEIDGEGLYFDLSGDSGAGVAHLSDYTNPHQVTKAQLGLGNVDNYSASSLLSRSNHTGTQSPYTIEIDLSHQWMTTAEKDKLASMEFGANNYTHPPTHSASMIQETEDRKFVTASEKLAISSVTGSSHSHSNKSVLDNITAAFTVTDKQKLDNVPSDGIFYVHPISHPSTMITEVSPKLFTSPDEKATWNDHVADKDNPHEVTKADVGLDLVENLSPESLRDRSTHTGTQPADTIEEDDDHLFMTTSYKQGVDLAVSRSHAHSNLPMLEQVTAAYTTEEKIKLTGIEAEANNYTHPSTHPATMITEDASHRFVSDAEKSTWSQDATTTQKGAVELATTAEAQAGTDATRAVTPDGALGLLNKWGLGGSITACTDANSLGLESGIYRVRGEWIGSPYSGISEKNVGTLFHLMEGGASESYIHQILIARNGGASRISVRRKINNVWDSWQIVWPNPSTLAVTSTDDATSTTSAPWKSAGGGAVAKGFRVGDYVTVGRSSMLSIYWSGGTRPTGSYKINIPGGAYSRIAGSCEFFVARAATMSVHKISFTAITTTGVIAQDASASSGGVTVTAALSADKQQVIITLDVTGATEIHIMGHLNLHSGNLGAPITTITQTWEDA